MRGREDYTWQVMLLVGLRSQQRVKTNNGEKACYLC